MMSQTYVLVYIIVAAVTTLVAMVVIPRIDTAFSDLDPGDLIVVGFLSLSLGAFWPLLACAFVLGCAAWIVNLCTRNLFRKG